MVDLDSILLNNEGQGHVTKNVPFSAKDAVDWLKSETELGKTSYGALRENTDRNDTVPISVWRAGTRSIPSAVALAGCLKSYLR